MNSIKTLHNTKIYSTFEHHVFGEVNSIAALLFRATLTFKFPGADGVGSDEKTHTHKQTQKHRFLVLGVKHPASSGSRLQLSQ
jgi:hypothetical protein